MTRIKLCGLSSEEDISCANELMPEYIGFVFAEKSSRYVAPERAKALKALLDPGIKAVGVFVNEEVSTVAMLLNDGVIDMAQLHGTEDDSYINELRASSAQPIIKAVKAASVDDVLAAQESAADHILLDSGAGTGRTFAWEIAEQVKRPYFLAGGLDVSNVWEAVRRLKPFAVDVSSGIETDGRKDKVKMAEFVSAVRKENI